MEKSRAEARRGFFFDLNGTIIMVVFALSMFNIVERCLVQYVTLIQYTVL